MKNLLTLLCCLFLFHTYIYGQDAVPFQFENKEKITIDATVQQLLINKEWHCYEMLYFEKGVQDRNPLRFSVEIKDDQTFTQSRKSGIWQIENNLLVFKIASDDYTKDKIFTAGAFSVQKINEEELVLVKNLSSSSVNRIAYFLAPAEIAKERYAANNPEMIRLRTTLPEHSNAVPVNYEIPYTKEEFAGKLKEAYFMRKLPAPEKDFSEWTLEELDEKYRELKGK